MTPPWASAARLLHSAHVVDVDGLYLRGLEGLELGVVLDLDAVYVYGVCGAREYLHGLVIGADSGEKREHLSGLASFGDGVVAEVDMVAVGPVLDPVRHDYGLLKHLHIVCEDDVPEVGGRSANLLVWQVADE